MSVDSTLNNAQRSEMQNFTKAPEPITAEPHFACVELHNERTNARKHEQSVFFFFFFFFFFFGCVFCSDTYGLQASFLVFYVSTISTTSV